MSTEDGRLQGGRVADPGPRAARWSSGVDAGRGDVVVLGADVEAEQAFVDIRVWGGAVPGNLGDLRGLTTFDAVMTVHAEDSAGRALAGPVRRTFLAGAVIDRGCLGGGCCAAGPSRPLRAGRADRDDRRGR